MAKKSQINSNKKNVTSATFKGMFWSFSGTSIQGLSQFIVLIVLTRTISPEAFGIVSAALVVISFSSIFSSLGVSSAIVQRPILKETHVTTGFTISLSLGIILSTILWLINPFVSMFFNIDELKPVLKVFSLVFIIQGFSLVSLSLLQREMKFKIIAKIQVMSYVIGYGLVSITLALIGFSYWSLIIGHLAQNILNTLFLVQAKPISKKVGIDKEAFNELMFFGGGHTIARIFNYFAIQGDNLMVGRLLGARDLGLYGRAYQLMVMPATLFGQVVDKVLFSAMSQVQSNKEKLLKSYKVGLISIALITMPLSVFIILLAEEIILILFGNEWTEVVMPFQILTFGMFFRTSYKISDSIARSTGFVYRRAWRQVVYAFLVVFGAYVGHFWGLNGIVVAVVIALMCNFTLMAHLSLKILNMRWNTFIHLHIPSIVLSMLVYIQLSISYPYLDSFLNSVFLILALSLVLTILTLTIPMVLFSKWFLQEEGIWLIHKLLNFVKNR